MFTQTDPNQFLAEKPSNNRTSQRLLKNIEKILIAWETRVKKEISAASQQGKLALRDSLPEYLRKLSEALSVPTDRSHLREKFDLEESVRLGKQHGSDRAGAADYTMDQMIYEYHILRQVIFDVLEEEAPLTDIEREIIICSIEQAVNDAATQFSHELRSIQEYLTRTIVHDLRNPIAAAKLGSQMIQRSSVDSDQHFKAAGRIINSMDRLDSMIQDLLDASRLGAGQGMPLKFEEFDLALVARQIADEFNLSFDHRLIVEAPSSIIGYWSKNGLSRVIENLITNAIKYGDPKAPITISIEKKSANGNVLLTVHNEGKAIPAEEQSILFQQFRRSKYVEGKTEGWGLGLTLVKGIVEAHQGTVNVISLEGKGTSFIVELPLDSRSMSTKRMTA